MWDESMDVPRREMAPVLFVIATAAKQSRKVPDVNWRSHDGLALRPVGPSLLVRNLRPVIGAAFVAAITVDAHPRDPSSVLQPIPDQAREVFQRRRAERPDPVQPPNSQPPAPPPHALLHPPH